MSALEAAVQTYWRNSQRALAGCQVAARRLAIASEMYRPDVEKIAMAATSSLTAAAKRSGR